MTLKKQIKEFIQDELELDAHSQEVEELKNEIENSEDFYIKIDGQEYRFISEFIAIDWEETAKNCLVDGYGNTFASYDGDEIEHHFEGELYHIFRIN